MVKTRRGTAYEQVENNKNDIIEQKRPKKQNNNSKINISMSRGGGFSAIFKK